MRTIFRSNTELLFPIYLVLIGLFAAGLASLDNLSPWHWAVSLCAYFCTGCLGITVTYHRHLSHKAFKFKYRWIEYLFSLFGCLGATGSPIGWVNIHVQHHSGSDTKNDPHSPQNGLWSVIRLNYQSNFQKWRLRHLVTDKFHRFLHNYYYAILLSWAGVLLVLGGFQLLFFLFVVPALIQITVSILSNYFNHKIGYRNFNTKEGSTNVWWLALIAWGEGWHNNHHAYPNRWSFRYRFWELDISEYVIRIVKA